MSARQFVLDLPARPPKLSRETFVVGESNAAALKTAEDWAASSERLLVVSGPKAAGKTHLARIISALIGAAYVELTDREEANPFDSVSQHLTVDGLEKCAEPHLILGTVEALPANGGRLVLVGRGRPADWARGLKDLQTRLNAAARIDLVEPDEALLKAVMKKLFADRQLRASAALVDFAAAQLPKTFDAIRRFVDGIDAASLERGRSVGLLLAHEVVANLSEAPSDA